MSYRPNRPGAPTISETLSGAKDDYGKSKSNIARSDVKNLEWSFRPYVILLQIFTGIQLNRTGKLGKTGYYLSIYGGVLLLANLGCHFMHFKQFGHDIQDIITEIFEYDFPSFLSVISPVFTTTFKILNSFTYIFGIPLWFYFAATATDKIKEVWNNLVEINHELDLDVQSYREIWKTAWIGLGLCCLVQLFQLMRIQMNPC